MLDSFRTNMRGVALGIVIVIGIIFAFSGAGGMLSGWGRSDTAIVVGDADIPEIDVVRAISNQRSRILNENDNIDSSVITDELLRPGIISQLISRQLMIQAAGDKGMAISDRRVGAYILTNEGFLVDGEFDQNSYRFILQQQGYTSATFKQRVVEDLLVEQFARGIIDTAFVTDFEIENLAKIIAETRDFYYLTIPFAPILESVSVLESEVQDYFQDNQLAYRTEAQAIVDFIELKPDTLAKSVSISPQAIEKRFEEERGTLNLAELRQAAHILLEDPSDEQIADIQAKIVSGEDFAELARTYSDDFGSSDLGGDLGFTSGDTFPVEFESALAELEVNAVSAPVTTDAGVHFIKLLAVQQQDYILADESSRIERELVREATSEELAAKLELLKELSFNADSLAEVAEDVGLDLGTSEAFSRAGGTGITAIPAVVSASFSDEVVVDGYASEVLDLGGDRYVVVKLKEYIDIRQKELSEVRDDVVSALSQQKAQAELDARGAELLQLALGGDSIEDIAKAQKLDWQVGNSVNRQDTSVDSEVRDRVFTLPKPSGNPASEGFYVSNGDYVVVSLLKAVPGDSSKVSSSEKDAFSRALISLNGNRDLTTYEQTLRTQTRIIQ
ncbi:SurA N-terminal domain-containing protein [Porticoccaceae bacterium]|nr:SurA N-terminal domain-containing protein [Porticoccaceae bacterium]MDA8681235.1 SurA N-terminal domain-containing protein [Porticoccaceae bacterium]MDA8788689.1 SurA N-terminal domain-containing protein [Porticoccaceae bacterium]MDB2343575.1 SurA N-terminal domain-containing protein [Porticoccaceae bacterium]